MARTRKTRESTETNKTNKNETNKTKKNEIASKYYNKNFIIMLRFLFTFIVMRSLW